jgi:MYXO-CTERM domain-containing protein
LATSGEGSADAGPTPPDAGETNDAQAADTNSGAAADSTNDDTESESGCSTTRQPSGVTAALLALAGILVRRRRN